MTSPSQPPDAYKQPPPAATERLSSRPASILDCRNVIVDQLRQKSRKKESPCRYYICAAAVPRLLCLAAALLLITVPLSAAPANYTAFDTG
ncbi:Hypothetical protein NTJ_13202 [Nesidiocoris tenuis]|uniref:KASH domain-containing protein n=1 Tax=Nesidiocoris tenuis TaxID=355587 RepID=A0ABN7B9A6_9HEMI|nr:Hypothetical protein NTJ_13202 [Nesidiocoris tenuis]